MVSVSSAAGEETLAERKATKEAAAREELLREPLVKALMETFPGASLIGLTGEEAAEEQVREALSEMGIEETPDEVDPEALEAFLNEGEDLE